MLATSAGIGLFLAFIGLQSSEGLGVVTYESATLVTLGGCPFEDRAPQYTLTADAAANVGRFSPRSLPLYIYWSRHACDDCARGSATCL
jgi:hypothetical protein